MLEFSPTVVGRNRERVRHACESGIAFLAEERCNQSAMTELKNAGYLRREEKGAPRGKKRFLRRQLQQSVGGGSTPPPTPRSRAHKK